MHTEVWGWGWPNQCRAGVPVARSSVLIKLNHRFIEIFGKYLVRIVLDAGGGGDRHRARAIDKNYEWLEFLLAC